MILWQLVKTAAQNCVVGVVFRQKRLLGTVSKLFGDESKRRQWLAVCAAAHFDRGRSFAWILI